MNMSFQAEEIVWTKAAAVQGISRKNKPLLWAECRVGLEKDIGREIGNMVCGADTEELGMPYQEIWFRAMGNGELPGV